MIVEQIDAALRAGAASICLLLAWLMLAHRRQLGLPSLLFAPLAVCLASFVLGNTPLSFAAPLGLPGDIAHGLSGFAVIFLWWFSLSCFERRFRLNGGVLVTGIAWALIAAADRGLFGQALDELGLSRVLVAMGFAIVGHLVWRLLAERQDDLIQRRHDARVLVAVLLGGMLFIDLAADALFGFDWRPLAFSMTQNAMILAFGLWLAGKLLTVRAEVLTFGANATHASLTPPADTSHNADLLRRLRDLIEVERVHLDPELSFARFVELMGAPERTVRMLVNQQLGHDHFRAFLNHYRVIEACRLLEKRGRDDKLIAIALDSGFASLASFNRAFRAVRGCTPSDYRRRAERLAEPLPDSAKAGF
jgi:AraC-like DNA-binding protein